MALFSCFNCCNRNGVVDTDDVVQGTLVSHSKRFAKNRPVVTNVYCCSKCGLYSKAVYTDTNIFVTQEMNPT